MKADLIARILRPEEPVGCLVRQPYRRPTAVAGAVRITDCRTVRLP